MAFRDIKRRARRDLHEAMKVAAFYFEQDPETQNVIGEPQPVFVRIHSKRELAGDMVGTNLSYAEVQEIQPRVIFMRDEVWMPVRNAVVSVEPGEAYRIDNVQPPDDITITAMVSRIPLSETIGLPYPGAP